MSPSERGEGAAYVAAVLPRLAYCSAEAARVVFAISANSANCERVFALIKTMFGEQQMLSLSDMIQAALMLRSNGRRVG